MECGVSAERFVPSLITKFWRVEQARTSEGLTLIFQYVDTLLGYEAKHNDVEHIVVLCQVSLCD